MIGKDFLTGEMADAIYETIPLEISILDVNDKVLAWNKHDSRIFKRPEKAVGRDVRQCHPPQSLSKVEQILSEMKTGKRDRAEFWIDLDLVPNEQPHKVYIRYFALRNPEGKYLGCLEASMDIYDIQGLSGEKRLLE